VIRPLLPADAAELAAHDRANRELLAPFEFERFGLARKLLLLGDERRDRGATTSIRAHRELTPSGAGTLVAQTGCTDQVRSVRAV
jgi:hypothetical protein